MNAVQKSRPLRHYKPTFGGKGFVMRLGCNYVPAVFESIRAARSWEGAEDAAAAAFAQLAPMPGKPLGAKP